MCGIVAVLSNEKPVAADLLAQAIARIGHRGPDSQGYWIAPHRRVGLGSARLKIIDLVSGDQPIASEDEQLQIVVNGEFYDHERIQCDLEQRGHRLRTRSDSEIALHLYEELGTACLEHLRGEFAFVLWDEANGLLFAARDRFGIKPLFYATVGGTLYLASEIKALLALGVPARWDHESFFQRGCLSLDQDRTLFEGIYQVPPGHFLLATPQRTQLFRYWDLDYPKADPAQADGPEAEQIDRVRQALVEATRLRLRADVPVGCYLSGGIDSSALFGIAAECATAPVDAFTIVFDDDPSDEAAVAEATARRVGARWFPLALTQDLLADHFADAVWHSETLVPDANVVAKYLLSRAVRDRGYKVVLTGEGADEIFAGYAYIHRDLLLDDVTASDPTVVKPSPQTLTGFGLPAVGVPALPTESVRQMLGFVPSFIQHHAQTACLHRPFFAPEFQAEFAHRDAYRMFLNRLDVPGQLKGRERVHQSLYLLSKSILPNFLLTALGDRMEMAHSVEGRLPFLDHPLVELVRQLPVSLKIRGLTEKYLLREAVRPFVTETVYQRRKSVFWSPAAAAHREGKFQQLLEDTLRSSLLASLPFYNQAAVIGLLDRLPRWRLQEHPALFGINVFLSNIASACILHDRFKLSTG
jgi:asparagine synthase (glutamine-hydrolysing)